MKNGHNSGTAALEPTEKAVDAKQAKDNKSSALAFVPRLLNIAAAGHYMGLSPWSVRELIWSGALPVVRVPRPNGDGDMNRILILRDDLDLYIDGLPKEYES